MFSLFQRILGIIILLIGLINLVFTLYSTYKVMENPSSAKSAVEYSAAVGVLSDIIAFAFGAALVMGYIEVGPPSFLPIKL